MKHLLGFIYAIILLAGCGLLFVAPPLGIVLIIVAVLGAGSMARRRQNKDEERRHKEILEAMKEGKKYGDKTKA